VGYLWATFGLPRPLCSRLRLDVCDRQTDRQTDRILVFLGLSVLDLGPMYATDVRQTSDKKHRLMPPLIRGGGIINRLPYDFEKLA